MTLEAATYTDTLNASYPEGTSPANELDNHIRLVKAALLATLPNITGPITVTQAELNLLAGAGALQHATLAGVWVLMRDVTVSGTPAAIDFVNGTSGVVISNLYDQYRIVFEEVKASVGTLELRLQTSQNAGSSFPGSATGANYQRDAIASGASTITGVTGAAYAIVGSTTSGVGGEASGEIVIQRPVNGALTAAFDSWSTLIGSGAMSRSAGSIACASAAFDAVRLTLSSSTFAGSTSRVKFYGRRA